VFDEDPNYRCSGCFGRGLSMSLAVAPLAAVTTGAPVEIDAVPEYSYLPDCIVHYPSDVENYTVELWGGVSGSFHVTASWGDGTQGGSWTKAGSFDTHHEFACGHGWRYQSWSASRSGGSTGYDYTQVFTQNV